MEAVLKKLYELVEQFTMGQHWKTYIDAFIFDCKMRNLSGHTIDVYAERLSYLAKYLNDQGVDIESVNKQHVNDYIRSIMDKVSGETVNGRIRTYRRFFGYITDEGFWKRPNPVQSLKLIRTAKRIKPVLSPEQMQTVLQTLDRTTYEGCRNFTMLMVLWDAMIRREELITLKIVDIELKAGLIKVYGKGRKERFVPVGPKTIKILHFFLHRFRAEHSGELAFCQRTGSPLTPRHCHKILERLGKKTNIHLYPHLVRHSAATYFIKQGGSPVILQKILGHTSLNVTQNYLHMNNSDMVESHGKFSPSNAIKI